MLGGEHLVTFSAVRAAMAQYPDLRLLHLDAHTDFIDELFGKKLSHGTVLRRIWEVMGDERIYAMGIRSGSKEDFREFREHVTIKNFGRSSENDLLTLLDNHPVYITLDLDVFDPAQIPGTGTPEAGGLRLSSSSVPENAFR